MFGDCVTGHILDREVDTMSPHSDRCSKNCSRYIRYNAELTKEGVAVLGLGDVDPDAVQKLDSIDAIPLLERVGQEARSAAG